MSTAIPTFSTVSRYGSTSRTATQLALKYIVLLEGKRGKQKEEKKKKKEEKRRKAITISLSLINDIMLCKSTYFA